MTKIIKSKVLISALFVALLCMLLGVAIALPTSAEELTPTASGTCGENATWEYYESTGKLKISGSGEMYSLEDVGYYMPWRGYYSDIRILIIEEGITNICAQMFCCQGGMMTPYPLTRIEIPSSVTSIGEKAFYNCVDLENIVFAQDSRLESIGAWAFSGCSSLSEITIPSNVTSIGDSAFYWCEGLTSVTFGDYTKISDFGENVFQYSEDGIERITLLSGAPINLQSNTLHGLSLLSIKEIYVSAEFFAQYKSHESWRAYSDKIFSLENTSGTPVPTQTGKCGENATYEFYESTGELKILGSGSMYNFEPWQTPWYSYRDDIKAVAIADEITSIGDYALYVSGLTKIVFGENSQLTSIGKGAFFVCSALTSIEIPSGVTVIGEDAFFGCSSLANVAFGENSQLTSIGDEAFNYCVSLVSIEFPASLKSIGKRVFSSCDSLISVAFGENSQLTSIGEGAFECCADLVSIEIPSMVTSIGNYAFMECHKLVEVYNFSALDIKRGSLSNGYVGYYAKVIHTSTKETIIENSGGYQIAYFDNEYYLLGYIGGEIDLILPTSFNYKGSDINQYEIYKYAFSNKSYIKSIQISLSVTGIGEYAFNNCTGITNITVPSSVDYIENGAFGNCKSLETLSVDEENDFYYSVGNCIIETAGKILIAGCKNSVLPQNEGIVAIAEDAFNHCKQLQSVEIPSTVTSIGELAFAYCSDLSSVKIPSSVTSIGPNAFAGCDKIIEEENGVSYVGKWAVSCDYSVTDISLREDTVGIVDTAFSWCDCLESVKLPSSITRIACGAFSVCNSLVSIEIPSSVTEIDKMAFSSCYSLERVKLPSSITRIGEQAFASCALESIEIPSSVTAIDEFAFLYCNSLTSAVFTSNVPPTLGYEVFYGTSIKEIYVPASVLDTYKSHEDWSEYKDIIFPIEGTGAPEIMYGDVDGDGEVNTLDVLALRKYMADFDYETNTSSTEVAAGADVNGNGTIDASDVLLLRKYMANYDYTTGTSSIVLGPKS